MVHVCIFILLLRIIIAMYLTMVQLLYTVVHIKRCHFYFMNSSVQHWLILIIFGMQHQEETRCK